MVSECLQPLWQIRPTSPPSAQFSSSLSKVISLCTRAALRYLLRCFSTGLRADGSRIESLDEGVGGDGVAQELDDPSEKAGTTLGKYFSTLHDIFLSFFE